MIKSSRPVLAGLDIGTTKVCMVIGVVNEVGVVDVVGVGTAPNSGVRQGTVVNIEATAESIRKAREEAELMSGYKVEEVWVGVGGTHIRSFDSVGMVAIKSREVTQQDVERVIEAAKAVAVPTDRSVLHVIPREYKVDSQDGILDPIGMAGIRLEASVHIVNGSQTAIANNLKCVEKAGLKVGGLVLEQLASAMSCISEDEKNLGVCLVDMGGGSCSLVYLVHGSVAHTSVVPIGGTHFTQDIAIGLRTPQVSAELLKKAHGLAMASLIVEDETIEVEGVGGRNSRTILRKDLADVIEPRAEELLQMIGHDLKMSGLMPLMGSGLVISGGTSQLPGLIEMGEFILDVPVRKGTPAQKVGGLVDVVKTPQYATAVGLLLYGQSQKKYTRATPMKDDFNRREAGLAVSGIGKRIKNFFEEMF